MQYRAALFAFTVVACLPAFAADPLPRAKPESVGMSSTRLARIGEVLKADIDKGRIPGAVVAIARKGKLVYYEAFGYLDKAAGTPMTKDAIFSIASMTKPLTGVAALTLYEEGKVLIKDPVANYLPQIGKMPVAVMRQDAAGQTVVETVPVTRPMQIHDLMRHTSGLIYGARGTTAVHKMYPGSSGTSGTTLTAAEFLDKLGSIPLMYQPGSTWEYGLSIDVLGLVVERVSGQTLGQYFDQRIFKPLGMVDSGFSVPPEKVKRYAKAFAIDPETGKPQSVLDATRPLKFECGGGCGVSTAADYIRFAQMLQNRGSLGKARILTPRTVEFMTSDHMGPEIQNNVARTASTLEGWGFGLTVAVRRETGMSTIMGAPGDFTWGGAYGTNFWVDPRDELSVVFMAHAPGEIRNHYRQLINALVMQSFEK
ncbi:MAG: penicillin-binding protein [Betaproteobacteria bacterium]|nr:penicillin-binding protein [Betaproteobacteria bacterium]